MPFSLRLEVLLGEVNLTFGERYYLQEQIMKELNKTIIDIFSNKSFHTDRQPDSGLG